MMLELKENMMDLSCVSYFHFILLVISANALVMNDACQTPLDVARAKGYRNVVRAIEVSPACLFLFQKNNWVIKFLPIEWKLTFSI